MKLFAVFLVVLVVVCLAAAAPQFAFSSRQGGYSRPGGFSYHDCTPSITICLRDEGCDPSKACVSYQCVDPCASHSCPGETPCYVEDHKPHCKFCSPGYTVNPGFGCVKGEKTITMGFNMSMLTTAGTIANTGPPPTCLMKITDPSGDSIEKAEIGGLLMLRIQVKPSNIYGGFARNCTALAANPYETGNEHIVTDDLGCATDPTFFGEWEQEDDGKILVAMFSTFKFPSSNSIRFQCNVQVCFGNCHSVNCNGYNAFGRRRRRQAGNNDAEVLLQPESVYDGQLKH